MTHVPAHDDIERLDDRRDCPSRTDDGGMVFERPEARRAEGQDALERIAGEYSVEEPRAVRSDHDLGVPEHSRFVCHREARECRADKAVRSECGGRFMFVRRAARAIRQLDERSIPRAFPRDIDEAPGRRRGARRVHCCSAKRAHNLRRVRRHGTPYAWEPAGAQKRHSIEAVVGELQNRVSAV